MSVNAECFCLDLLIVLSYLFCPIQQNGRIGCTRSEAQSKLCINPTKPCISECPWCPHYSGLGGWGAPPFKELSPPPPWKTNLFCNITFCSLFLQLRSDVAGFESNILHCLISFHYICIHTAVQNMWIIRWMVHNMHIQYVSSPHCRHFLAPPVGM